MGEHGVKNGIPEEMLPIINLYYLPNGGDADLYSTISPVNTFRVILNYYFNMDFELLKDVSYFWNTKEYTDFTPEFADFPTYDNFCDVEGQ